MAMTVKKDNNEVRIQWRVADIKIPTSEIKNITQDIDFLFYSVIMSHVRTEDRK